MKRIAVASRWIDGVSGATVNILERTRRFVDQGWKVDLYGERLDVERINLAGGAAHRIVGWPWGSYLKRRIFAWACERKMDGRDFDIVEGHGDTLKQDVLILHNCVHAAHEAVHGSPLSESSGVGRIHARALRESRFRLLIANSELMKRDVKGRFNVAEEKIRVVYPGYDPKRFNTDNHESLGASVRSEIGLRKGEILIGLVTSGDFRKRGVDIFIRSLARLNIEHRDKVRGLVVGKEKRLDDYRRLAQDAGIGSRVHFLPARTEVERYYHALDLFFYPARYEEFGQSVEEAMACGVPVLSSARVGACELLGKEGPAMLLSELSEDLFSRRISELIARPELRRAWSEIGLRAVRDNTWERYFQRTRELYKPLLLS